LKSNSTLAPWEIHYRDEQIIEIMVQLSKEESHVHRSEIIIVTADNKRKENV
jgi:hypothetical protein